MTSFHNGQIINEVSLLTSNQQVFILTLYLLGPFSRLKSMNPTKRKALHDSNNYKVSVSLV